MSPDQITLLSQILRRFRWRTLPQGFSRGRWRINISTMTWQATSWGKCNCTMCRTPFFFHAFLTNGLRDSCFALPLESADPSIQALQIAVALTTWTEEREKTDA